MLLASCVRWRTAHRRKATDAELSSIRREIIVLPTCQERHPSLRVPVDLEPLKPLNGRIAMPDRPGMGLALDPAKIEQGRELRWS